MNIGRRNIIKGIVAILIICGVSVYESLVPWYGNRTDWSKIRWYQYAEIYLCLISGPISGIYDQIRWGNQSFTSLCKGWLQIVGVASLLSYVPTILAFKIKRYDILLLFIGLFFWIVSTHYLLIGIRV